MLKTQYYRYDVWGCLQESDSRRMTILVSTVKLPPFSRLRRYKGKCAVHGIDFPRNAPVGKVFNLAIGDPRIVRGCKLVSKTSEEIPKEVKEKIDSPEEAFTFNYRRGKIWADHRYLCRLGDLRKSSEE